MTRENMKKRREQLGFSQVDVASAAGIDKGTYYRIEKTGAETTVSVFELIAKKLESSTDYLLGLTDAPDKTLKEQGVSADERILLAKVRSGEMKEAANAALDLAEKNHQANISGMKPAADS